MTQLIYATTTIISLILELSKSLVNLYLLHHRSNIIPWPNVNTNIYIGHNDFNWASFFATSISRCCKDACNCQSFSFSVINPFLSICKRSSISFNCPKYAQSLSNMSTQNKGFRLDTGAYFRSSTCKLYIRRALKVTYKHYKPT